jgi:hypothetical protein
MIGNFKIYSFTNKELIDAGYDVFIQRWEDIPISNLLVANLTGKKYLTSFGNGFQADIVISKLSSSEIENYTKLNGQVVPVLKDNTDTIMYFCNCIVEPQKFNGKPFFNAVKLKLTTVQGHHETSTRLSGIDPIKMYDEDQEFLLSYYNQDGNQGIISYNRKMEDVYLLFEDGSNWITENNELLKGG